MILGSVLEWRFGNALVYSICKCYKMGKSWRWNLSII